MADAPKTASGERYSATRQRSSRLRYCAMCLAIQAGDVYYRLTEFPGGSAGSADTAKHPVSIDVCSECASVTQDPRLLAVRSTS